MISYYELLGMIKEDKEPHKIRVHLTSEPREYRAVYDKGVYDYFDFNYYELVGKENDDYKDYLADSYLESMMFDKTIEILEEKKIPEKIKIDNEDRIQGLSTGNFVYKVNQPTKNIIYKINEIIDYLNKLK